MLERCCQCIIHYVLSVHNSLSYYYYYYYINNCILYCFLETEFRKCLDSLQRFGKYDSKLFVDKQYNAIIF